MEERLSLGLHCAGGMEAAGARQASGERPATYHKNGSGRKEKEKENEKKDRRFRFCKLFFLKKKQKTRNLLACKLI
jgi:hypothetical protein